METLLARAAQENFRVAPRLLPSDVRGHLMAVYGYARLVDHLGDEAPGDRLALLAWLDDDVTRLYGSDDPRHPLVRALAPTVDRFAIPDTPLRALIAANRADQRVTRYARYDDLLGYCALSANPVGHLVLAVFEAATPQHLEWSDRICSGLQLAEHWQDVAEDHRAGRIYLPAEDLERFGVRDEELGHRHASDRFRQLLAFEVERTRALLDSGLGLVGAVGGRPRLAVAGFAAGGLAALRAIAAGGYDVLGGVPRPGRGLKARVLVDVLRRGAAA